MRFENVHAPWERSSAGTASGRRLIALLILAVFPAFAGGLSGGGKVRVEGLRCEYFVNPLGIEVARPRLSWLLQSGRRGEVQAAYQVLVATSPDLLRRNQGDLWDSGRVASDRSIQVEYGGRRLNSRARCHWKVRVWGKDGEASAWSRLAEWTMGLRNPEDWRAKWITMEAETLAHPWMRREFALPAPAERALLYVNTPGHYEVYVNGRRVGSEVLLPPHANIRKRFLYNVHDVTGHLRKGLNCVAFWLGPGWYQPAYGNPGKAPILRAQLEMATATGSQVVATDASWRVRDSCLSQVGTWAWGDMGGERWDARKYVEDWNNIHLDDSRWHKAVEVAAPDVPSSWQALPGSRLGPPIQAKTIYPHGTNWVIDFGAPLTGWVHLRLNRLKPGQEITIEYADLPAELRHLAHMTNSQGFQTFNQRDVFVAGRERTGVLQSKFNQHAFRYAVIGGLADAPRLKDAEARIVRTDLESAGSFECSNELFNRIHRVTVNTLGTQMPAGVLGGGEAREKLGYGDGGAFLSGLLYNFRSDAFFSKWLRDWLDGQRADGFLGHTAPEYYPTGGGPSWGGQASELVRRLAVWFSDTRAASESYTALRRYVDFLESHTEGDILRYYNPYPPGNYLRWYFLGDWNPPGASADEHGFVFESEQEREFFNNCYRVLLWDELAAFARLLGDDAEYQRCKDRLAGLRPLVHRTYFDAARNTYGPNRQAYLAIALYAGVVPASLRSDIFRQLESDIVHRRNGHLDTGMLGTFILLDLLTRENRHNLVALMMNQTGFPGWGFLLRERNAATWPESWSGWGSQVIQVVGSPGAWFYEGLAGIRPDLEHPGFRRFHIRPGVVDSVEWVRCRYRCPHGNIVSDWRREGRSLRLKIEVPPNTSAIVTVPTRSPDAVTESGVPARDAEGVKLIAAPASEAVFHVASGSYSFRAELP
ncbi:MAG TPA: family 78 glycoside hydrolase catalytic domain [Candidatus Paceibacterota bacterium]|nr:family 78 glycoside hydrolase catalytic domain [Verrucomicrobiota bacterium]HSA11737.1 family 78 glycoside hydrolase catalytic domain [Candidatus Paceibacterota bacterium]